MGQSACSCYSPDVNSSIEASLDQSPPAEVKFEDELVQITSAPAVGTEAPTSDARTPDELAQVASVVVGTTEPPTSDPKTLDEQDGEQATEVSPAPPSANVSPAIITIKTNPSIQEFEPTPHHAASQSSSSLTSEGEGAVKTASQASNTSMTSGVTVDALSSLAVQGGARVDQETAAQLGFEEETLQITLADPGPRDAAQAKSFGWRDISKTGAAVYYKSKPSTATDNCGVCAVMLMKSQDQVPELPLLTMKDGKIQNGVIPTLWAVEYWHLWFPFCRSSSILKRFSPVSFVAIVTLRVMMFTVDFVMYMAVKDKLATEGKIELIMRSPPSGSEGQEWMGITVPPKAGVLPRVCINFNIFSAIPTSMTTVNCDMHCVVEDPYGAPDWIKVKFLQQLSIRLIPEIVQFQKKGFAGSDLDKFLNGRTEGCADAESLAFIQDINKSITEFVQKRRQ